MGGFVLLGFYFTDDYTHQSSHKPTVASTAFLVWFFKSYRPIQRFNVVMLSECETSPVFVVSGDPSLHSG
jgi:hypothetical protein